MTDLSSADAPRTGDRQYHIALERGEVAEYIVLVGDPGRVAKVTSRWDSVELNRSNREITTATGIYRGMRLIGHVDRDGHRTTSRSCSPR